MQPPGSEGRRNYETAGVFSPDGEYLPFVAPIVTEGRPEEWLNTVEEAMFVATKRHLYRVEHRPVLCHLARLPFQTAQEAFLCCQLLTL